MIDPIAKLHSPDGTLLSVYANRRAPATRAALVELLKPLRSGDRARSHQKSIRTDSARMIEMAARIDSGAAPAVALFASHADGILEYQPLTDPVAEDVAMIGPRPYLRPLRAQPRPLRVGILIADSNKARTYLSAGGVLSEIGEELTTDPGKDNYGGFAGLEEHHNRARADEISAKLWRHAGRRLLEAHQDQPLEMIVIGGHDEAFDLIAAEQHAYLHNLPQGRVQVDPGTLSRAELTNLVATAISAQRHRTEVELLDRLIDEVDAGGAAVSGLSGVLNACNAHAIDHLVVAGPFSKEGVLCDACGWLGRTGPQCPVCGSTLYEVSDVVSAAMDAAVEAGGRVSIVSVASRLDAVGVAAFTRFNVA